MRNRATFLKQLVELSAGARLAAHKDINTCVYPIVVEPNFDPDVTKMFWDLYKPTAGSILVSADYYRDLTYALEINPLEQKSFTFEGVQVICDQYLPAHTCVDFDVLMDYMGDGEVRSMLHGRFQSGGSCRVTQ
jgi:hypothetical protein